MNNHCLTALLQDGAIAPWNQITDVNTDSDDIGTISEDEQAALDAFYGRFTTIALADESSTSLADDKAAAVIIDKATAIDTFTADSESAAVIKVPRKKKLPELFHTEVQVSERRQNDNVIIITVQYTVHILQPNEEYVTEQKSATIHFKKYKNQEKRPKTAAYKAKDSTIHNYGMVYKPGCPCNFTRVARFILEHPNHLFKNGIPIPENLTILYYDNI